MDEVISSGQFEIVGGWVSTVNQDDIVTLFYARIIITFLKRTPGKFYQNVPCLMTTSKVQTASLLLPSLNVYVTVVLPGTNLLPGIWLCDTSVTFPDASIADGISQWTGVFSNPNSMFLVISAGHELMIGSVESTGEIK